MNQEQSHNYCNLFLSIGGCSLSSVTISVYCGVHPVLYTGALTGGLKATAMPH